jgi:four helix bundle protein
MADVTTVEAFEDLEAWKKARELTQSIYEICARGEFGRDYGLKDQICRAAVSVMSNIAEGFERGGDKEFFQFLAQAKRSCGEIRSQLYVARDQRYISHEQFDCLVDRSMEISRLIFGLMQYLKKSTMRGNKYR